MSIASKIVDLLERIRIDPKGVQNEITADIEFNSKFKSRLIPYGGNKFFDPKTDKVFEISEDGTRITNVLSDKEKAELTKGLPRA